MTWADKVINGEKDLIDESIKRHNDDAIRETALYNDLVNVVNKHKAGCNTPNHILALYIWKSIKLFQDTVFLRDHPNFPEGE